MSAVGGGPRDGVSPPRGSAEHPRTQRVKPQPRVPGTSLLTDQRHTSRRRQTVPLRRLLPALRSHPESPNTKSARMIQIPRPPWGNRVTVQVKRERLRAGGSATRLGLGLSQSSSVRIPALLRQTRRLRAIPTEHVAGHRAEDRAAPRAPQLAPEPTPPAAPRINGIARGHRLVPLLVPPLRTTSSRASVSRPTQSLFLHRVNRLPGAWACVLKEQCLAVLAHCPSTPSGTHAARSAPSSHAPMISTPTGRQRGIGRRVLRRPETGHARCAGPRPL